MIRPSSELAYCEPIPGHEDTETHLMQNYHASIWELSLFISSMTLCRESEEEEHKNQNLMTLTIRNIATLRIPDLFISQQSAKIESSPRQGGLPMNQKVSFDKPPQEWGSDIICHGCYELNHYAPDCFLPLRHQTRVVQNNEHLTRVERMSVPTKSNHRVRTIFNADQDENKYSTQQVTSQHRVQERANILTQFTLKVRRAIQGSYSLGRKGEAIRK